MLSQYLRGKNEEFNSYGVPEIAPPNDLCADALPLVLNGNVLGNIAQATVDNTGDCGTDLTTAGIWYSFIGTGGVMNVFTCNTANFDTYIIMMYNIMLNSFRRSYFWINDSSTFRSYICH